MYRKQEGKDGAYLSTQYNLISTNSNRVKENNSGFA